MFDNLGIEPESITMAEDLRQLPFTNPDDVVRLSPYFRAAQGVTIYASSGTTGKPKYSFFTPSDLERTYERTAASLKLCGFTANDVLAVAHGFGIWLIGTDFTISAQKLGATVLPVGKGPSALHILEMMLATGVTYIATSPSYGRRLADLAAEKGINLARSLKIKGLLLAGETVSTNLRSHLQHQWGAEHIFSCYGSTENGTIGCESEQHKDIHLWTDEFLFEVISLTSDQPVEEGEQGELVITTLTHEGMPLIRYRTGDLVSWHSRAVEGFPTKLSVRIFGRLDEAIVLEAGEKLWPHQVDEVLKHFPEVTDYQIVIREVTVDSIWLDRQDELHILIVTDRTANDSEGLSLRIQKALAEASLDFSASAGFTAAITIDFVQENDLLQTETGKTPRFVDQRQFPTVRSLITSTDRSV